MEAESRRVEAQMRQLENKLGQAPDENSDPEPAEDDQFKGALFKQAEISPGTPMPRRTTLKIQRRRIRNRVIILGVVVLILAWLVWKTVSQ
ncbi:MAG: hypothetical protein HC904_15150 [Blastochloris sp.]|nr:hypothetical protein [Blastochloris sp.]